MADLDKIVTEYSKLKANRREFITRLGSAGLGVAAGTVIAGCGGGGGSFGANNGGGGPISEAAIKAAFLDIQMDENDHVTFLKAALGGAARPRPTFDPKLLTVPDEPTLWKISSALENTGPGAYLYAVPYIGLTGAPAVLQAAASIAIVEGRHAGFLNILTGKNILLSDPNSPTGAPDPSTGLPTGLDALGPPQMGNGSALTPGDPQGSKNAAVTGLGFTHSQEIPQPPSQTAARAAGFLGTVVTGTIAPGTDNTGSGKTYLNGGPGFPPDDLSTGVATNDILNFALLLEYLERDFYNINVTKIYGGSPAYSQTGP